jgi:hypothetical protein
LGTAAPSARINGIRFSGHRLSVMLLPGYGRVIGEASLRGNAFAWRWAVRMAKEDMKPMKINDEKSLRAWLEDKPAEWAQAIAGRSALRVLHWINFASHDWLQKNALTVLRSVSMSWAALSYPAHNFSGAAKSAAHVCSLAADIAEFSEDDGVAEAAYAAANAAETGASFGANKDAAAEAAGSASGAGTIFWDAVQKDCAWLTAHDTSRTAPRILSMKSLWLDRELGLEANSLSPLLEIDTNYGIWLVWHRRRFRGERAAFDIPGDKYRKEDKKILRRLAEATDEDFWGKGHEYVNATLKGWLDEARERVAQPTVSSPVGMAVSHETALALLPAPTQDTSATTYGVNEQGKLDRLPNSDQVHLRDVPDQRRAYADLREAAAELLSEGQRLGHRLKRALDRFLQSLPDQFEDAEAYLVWRDANALRRLHRAHREAAKISEPDEAKLEPVVAEGLGGLLDLFNNFAFADDGLRAKDEARISLQERNSAEVEAKAAIPLVAAILANPEIVTPEVLDDIAADTENAELPADDPYADQVLDQANRARRNLFAGLIGDTWAAFKNANFLVQNLVGNAAYDGAIIATTVIGGIEYAPLLEFIAANPIPLQHYVAIAFPSFEYLPTLIEQLKILWAKLRN